MLEGLSCPTTTHFFCFTFLHHLAQGAASYKHRGSEYEKASGGLLHSREHDPFQPFACELCISTRNHHNLNTEGNTRSFLRETLPSFLFSEKLPTAFGQVGAGTSSRQRALQLPDTPCPAPHSAALRRHNGPAPAAAHARCGGGGGPCPASPLPSPRVPWRRRERQRGGRQRGRPAARWRRRRSTRPWSTSPRRRNSERAAEGRRGGRAPGGSARLPGLPGCCLGAAAGRAARLPFLTPGPRGGRLGSCSSGGRPARSGAAGEDYVSHHAPGGAAGRGGWSRGAT